VSFISKKGSVIFQGLIKTECLNGTPRWGRGEPDIASLNDAVAEAETRTSNEHNTFDGFRKRETLKRKVWMS
jgi:hypothetical protein